MRTRSSRKRPGKVCSRGGCYCLHAFVLKIGGHGMRFAQKYGKWAVIAGASEGIGAAFAGALAERGLNLVLVARRPEPLSELSTQLGVQTITVSADLSTADGLAEVFAATEDREVGLVVCNRAYAPGGWVLG